MLVRMSKKASAGGESHFDVAVIGGGSAGYAAARTAAAAGLKTVVIEGGAEVGGLCILRGCMPSKALLYTAEVLHLAKMAKTWGIKVSKVGFDFQAVMARKKAMIDDFAQYRRDGLNSGKFKFLRANASFLDPHTVALTAVEGTVPKVVKSNHFVISGGSVMAPAMVPHLWETGFLTSDDILSLKKLPRSIIVLGGGPVAVELTQFLARFGVKITLIIRGAQILKEFDAEAAEVVETVLKRDGVEIWKSATITEAFRKGRKKGVSILCGDKPHVVMADEILHAFGRVPATTGLDLDKAGVELDNGRIVTNAAMQTSARHIYAAGDCTGPYQIVHIAVEQGEIAAHNIAHPRKPRKIDYRLLTSIVFSDPQAAMVGLSEKAARERKIPHRAASYPFNDHGKSLIMEAKDGFVKLVADPVSGEILGGTCVGPQGGELIHEIIAAMHQRMTVRELAMMPHYHPTLAEIWTYPAAELAGLP